MAKKIWVPAIVIPAIILVISLAIFAALVFFLDFFHDYALPIGTVIFIAISAIAWVLGSRAEAEFQQNNPNAGGSHH